jgi:hypothetical protein
MTLGHNPSIVTSGLSLCLDAGNPRSYPGSGTSWIDISGNNSNGTLSNGPTYTSGINGYMTLDGVDDYISVPSISPGSANTSFSFGGWVYLNSLPSDSANYFIISNYGDISHAGFFAIRTTTAGAYFWCRHNDGSTMATTPTTSISASQWYYFTAVRNATSNLIELYINGSSTGTASFLGTYQCKDAGSYYWVGVHYLTSYISCRVAGTFCYSTTALTAAQVLQNFNATRGRYGI